MIFINVMKNRILEFFLKFIIVFEISGLLLGVSLVILELLERKDLVNKIVKIFI
jgi:hypothetical protein